jgi:hypothetical protein
MNGVGGQKVECAKEYYFTATATTTAAAAATATATATAVDVANNNNNNLARCSVVVKALCYEPEGRWFDTR